MQIVHESGHVIAALATGGEIRRVVLDPATISRTDFVANPQPHLTVWAGPIGGILLPLCAQMIVAALNRTSASARIATFFLGFCLIANGGYLMFGAFDGVGDCEVMLRCGTSFSMLVITGGAMMVAGFGVWHTLGTLNQYLSHRSFPTTALVLWSMLLATLSVVLCRFFFPDA